MESSDYEHLAAEYYDSSLHPTCRSFRELSELYLNERIEKFLRPTGLFLEVGAGRSVLAPLIQQVGIRFDQLTLVDKSAAMLRHSDVWAAVGARTIVAAAQNTKLNSNSFDLIVSSLGDPYNEFAFWLEIARLLRLGGHCLFTTPAYEWAKVFRQPGREEMAEFLSTDGSILQMPSNVPDEKSLCNMLREAGLILVDEQTYLIGHLKGPVAPKLKIVGRSVPVLRGISVTLAG